MGEIEVRVEIEGRGNFSFLFKLCYVFQFDVMFVNFLLYFLYFEICQGLDSIFEISFY